MHSLGRARRSTSRGRRPSAQARSAPSLACYESRVLAAIMFAAWSTVPPDGWARAPEVAEGLPSRDVDVVGFRAADREAIYVVAHAWLGNGTSVAAAIARRADLASGQAVRTQRRDRGRTFDDVEVTFPDGSQAHLHTVESPHESVYGLCRGRGASFAACERTLAQLDVPPDGEGRTGLPWLLIALGAAVLGALALVVAVPRWRGRREIARSPPLVDGELVTIAGTVRALGALIEEPLAGRACVYHRTRARLFATGSSAQAVAEPIEIAAAAFVVDTPRGAIRVEEAALELELPPSSVVALATPGQLSFLARHGAAADVVPMLDEIVIAPSDRITLRGVVELVSDPQGADERGYRDRGPVVARLVSTATSPITLLRRW
jgi:hypothetical protein